MRIQPNLDHAILLVSSVFVLGLCLSSVLTTTLTVFGVPDTNDLTARVVFLVIVLIHPSKFSG